jgi:phospholipid/cholesterol/gamma-HCH transport system ATP-binding protein
MNVAQEVVVDIRKFRKSFGSKVIHQSIDLEIFRGECIGLFGGSGAGKSVILRSLIGLEKPDSGEIIIESQDITKLSERALIPIRKSVAYVFQGGALFDSMTVFENLAYPLIEHTEFGPKEIRTKVLGLLEEFGLKGCEELLPASLSGGMQKRVGLARAIILEPSVVLYDEPTAGLDPYNTKRIQEMILKLKGRGVTSVLVTHDMPSAFAVCDRIALLLDGSIYAVVPTHELAEQYNAGQGGSQDTLKKFDETKVRLTHFINGEEA